LLCTPPEPPFAKVTSSGTLTARRMDHPDSSPEGNSRGMVTTCSSTDSIGKMHAPQVTQGGPTPVRRPRLGQLTSSRIRYLDRPGRTLSRPHSALRGSPRAKKSCLPFRGPLQIRRRRLNTVLRLTPSLVATSIALPLNGSGSTYRLALPRTARSPSTRASSTRFASLPSPTKFFSRTGTCLRIARPPRLHSAGPWSPHGYPPRR
jgi:hypothetical protein